MYLRPTEPKIQFIIKSVWRYWLWERRLRRGRENQWNNNILLYFCSFFIIIIKLSLLLFFIIIIIKKKRRRFKWDPLSLFDFSLHLSLTPSPLKLQNYTVIYTVKFHWEDVKKKIYISYNLQY